MADFGVWAPHATKVEVDIRGLRTLMQPQEGGWWATQVPEASPGGNYAFVQDEGEPLPDPRSPWQPSGVHGPSRLVDHAAFPWTDKGWQAPPLASAVIYEIHIGTFTAKGTFEDAIARLDYLVDLGVTHVELMPVNEFPGNRGWGYDGVDLYAPHHAYGGPMGLKRLVDACHSRRVAVILDVVYNHLGPEGNYLARCGPYFTDRYRTPWGPAMNLDGPDSDEVRRFLLNNAVMWLRDYHFDGLRIDAVHAIIDTSAIHFLEQLATEVEALEAQLGRHLVLIAESDLNDSRIVRPRELGGYGLDAQWNEDFHHSLHAILTGERIGYYADFWALADLAKALQQGFVYDGRYSGYRRRRHGRPATGLSGHQFIGFLQNHDQVGNRPRGERAGHLLTHGRLKVGAALVFISPFIPLIFQGEEWGASTPFQFFTEFQDPELGKAVREGRRREFIAFGWDPVLIPDPQAPETYQRSKLNWSELSQEPHASLLEWYKSLTRLRRKLPSLQDGRLDRVRVRFSEGEQWLVVERTPAVIACNLSQQSQSVPLHGANHLRMLLASAQDIQVQPESLEVPAESVVLLGT